MAHLSGDVPIRSDLARVDDYELTAADYDEIPELTDAMIARARIVSRDGSVLPTPHGALRDHVPVALQPAIVEHFRAKGSNWETRINDALMAIVDHETRKRRAG